jgi:hypothetical protein
MGQRPAVVTKIKEEEGLLPVHLLRVVLSQLLQLLRAVRLDRVERPLEPPSLRRQLVLTAAAEQAAPVAAKADDSLKSEDRGFESLPGPNPTTSKFKTTTPALW